MIATTALPGGTVGTPYSAGLAAQGGISPYTWSVVSGYVSGNLPAGLALNPSTGVISGIPTGGGTYNFTVGVSDSSVPPQSATQRLSITVSTATSTFSIASFPGGLSISVDGSI